MKRRIKHLQAGFTIIELMIATVVFSIILLVITAAVVHFSTAYYKGVNSSTTQNTVRSALDTVVQAIQFTDPSSVGTTSGTNPGYVCIGGLEFAYNRGPELPAGNYALYEFTPPAGCPNPSTIVGFPTGGKELLGPNMRLVTFSVQHPGSLYSVDIKVAYGDDDLLCSPTVTLNGTNSCQMGQSMGLSPGTPANFAKSDLRCKSETGSQFCAVTELTTAVGPRL